MSRQHFDSAVRLVTQVKPVAVAAAAHTTSRNAVITFVANFMRNFFKDLVDNWETVAKAGPTSELRAHRAGLIAGSCEAISNYFYREVSLLPAISDPDRAVVAFKTLMESMDAAIRQAEADASA